MNEDSLSNHKMGWGSLHISTAFYEEDDTLTLAQIRAGAIKNTPLH